MHTYIEPFGYHVYSDSIGKAWLDMVDLIINKGEHTLDEGRKRLCVQNLRIKIENPKLPDPLIEKYADKKNIDDIIHLTFSGNKMYDIDVKPSFSPGAKSYCARIKEGQMDEYIINRLSLIPESKKAVISFIHWDDYKAVLANPYDDYLPCIVSIQFRLVEKEGKYYLTVIINSRSIDAYQKSVGNLVAITMLAQKITDKLQENLNKPVILKAIDGLITDAHIYEECYSDAKELINNYKNN